MQMKLPGFHTGYFGGREEFQFVGHCHSVMHENETIQNFVLSMRLYKSSSFLGGGG